MSEFYSSKLLMKGIWQITNKPDGVHSYVDMYLIEGSSKALLVDAGESNEDLIGFIRTLTEKPVDLLITHGHGDHAAAFAQFDRVFLSHQDIDILNTIFGYNMDETMVINLQGGEVFDLGDCKLEVIALPGHTYGSVVLLDAERQLLFSSDSLGSGGIWMQLPQCTSVEAYAGELRRLEQRVEGMDHLQIFVGHDCQRSLGFGKSYLQDVRTVAEKIVSGEVIGRPTENKDDFFGGLFASYGQMSEFIYKPGNIHMK